MLWQCLERDFPAETVSGCGHFFSTGTSALTTLKPSSSWACSGAEWTSNGSIIRFACGGICHTIKGLAPAFGSSSTSELLWMKKTASWEISRDPFFFSCFFLFVLGFFAVFFVLFFLDF